MRQYLLTIIAVLTAIILALFSFDTINEPYPARSYRTYSYNLASNIWSGIEDGTQSVPIEDNTGAVVPSLSEANTTVESLLALSKAGSSLGTPPALLEADAMSELAPVQLPPLDAGMVNVTGGFGENTHTAGYRVNPRFGEFAIAVPYDPSLLPQGFTEDDIQTYVYDRHYNRWVAIQRDSVNEAELLVCSRFRPWEKGLPHTQNDLTNPQAALAQVQDMMSFASQGEGGGDSPLDFINAVLKTPEMPETSSYTPTSIKELKAANPLEGLTLMQPPTANNSGTANLSYPIEIPAGRQGMQPNLALTYSSGGGNGWLGVGWDISIPSITVETRWGVPRYDQQKESEVYVYEGEQLVSKDGNGNFREMPHRTNQWTNRSTLGNVEQFYPRRNEAFDSIVRHGSGPDNYWWSVTHRNGVTDYYGKYASDSTVNNDCVLRTDVVNRTGAIAHWALAESVNPDGNSVRYYYDVAFENLASDGMVGKQIYVDSIIYTNFGSTQGMYKVVFTRKDSTREDVVVSANRGFVEITAERLCNISVFYKDSYNMIIREYFFLYEMGRHSNYKTRLTHVLRNNNKDDGEPLCADSIQELENRNMTCTHFEYFDAPQGNAMFGDEQTIDLGSTNDNIGAFFITNPTDLVNVGTSTALGSTRGKSWNVGGTASVGIDANVAMTSASVGGNFNYSRSKSEGALTLIDLNGDGLADKVFKIGNNLYYRPQIADNNFSFHYGERKPILGIKNFLQDVSSTTSWGLQASVGLAYSGSWPTTRSTTSVYFSDVNADGLPDLITDDGVLFNVTEEGGNVAFKNFYTMMEENMDVPRIDSNTVTTSVDSCLGIIFDGEASDSIICFINWIRDTTYCAKPCMDIISRQTLNMVDSLEQTGEYRCERKYTVCQDSVPQVYEIDLYRKETTCLPIFSQTSNSDIVTIPDPDLEAVKIWVPQKVGIVNIRSRFRLLNDDTAGLRQSKWRDGVSYAVQVCRGVTADNDYVLHADSYDTLFTRHVDKNDTALKDTTFSVDLDLDDLVLFRLISGDNHDFDKVSWRQTITYSGVISEDQYGLNSNFYDSKEDFVLSGRNHFSAPLDTGRTYIRIINDIRTSSPNQHTFTPPQYQLTVSINNRTGLNSLNTSYPIVNNLNIIDTFSFHNNQYIAVDTNCFIEFKLQKRTVTSINQKFDWSKVHIVPHVEYFIRKNGQYEKVQDYYPPVNMDIGNYRNTRTDSVYHVLFGPLYRGWGQFAYNNNDTANGSTSHDHYIHLDKLIADDVLFGSDVSHFNNKKSKINGFRNQFTRDTLNPQESSDIISHYDDSEVHNPLSQTTSWIEMQPDCRNNAWIGYGNINFLTEDIMSNTRLPEYSADTGTVNIEEFDHPVPIVDGHEVKTVRKQNISRMKNHSLSLAVLPVIQMGASYSNGENIILTDYMDLNGDRYPDIVGQSMVQYSNPWGGIGSPIPMGPFANGITKSETYSAGFNFGGSFNMPSRGASNNPKSSKISFDGSGSPGIDLGGGSDETGFTWMDINGDGLPDKIKTDNVSGTYVSLNTGYGFQTLTFFGNFPIRNGDSQNAGLSFGANFNLGQASIGGGMGVNVSRNRTRKSLMDFNGDGLPDMVTKNGETLFVQYNKGFGSWSAEEAISILSDISYGHSYSESINASVTVGFTFMSIVKLCLGISGSPYNRTFSKDSVQLTDINGDGYVDFVTSSCETSMTVRYNQSGKANLLRKITNFTGSTIELDYDMPLASYDKPQRSWNLASVKTRNSDTLCPVGGNSTFTTFAYENPHHNRMERMDYGYGKVTTYQHDTDGSYTLYRYTVEEFNNRDFIKRGRKTRDCIYDAHGRPYVEHLYDAVVFDYAGSQISDGGCTRADVYVGVESDLTNWYEGQTVPQITSRTTRKYDRYRNVIRYSFDGIVGNGNAQKFIASISYKPSAGLNMVSLPESVTVFNHDSSMVFQRRTAEYDNMGHLLKLTRHNNGYVAEWEFNYDNYGNMIWAILPENVNGQRLKFKYDYDSVVHTYPVSMENASMGYVSTAEYDYHFGKPTKTTDINGNEMRYEYDMLGRTTKITAPYELEDSIPYTISMEYHPHCNADFSSLYNDSTAYSYATTYHYDRQHPNNPIKTTLIADGLGRILQTKKDAEIGGNEISLVTGKVIYDCFGRTVAQYHPFTEDTARHASYNDSVVIGTETFTEYDIMDRQTRVELPTHDETLMAYGFETIGSSKYFSTTTTDALGNSVQVLKGVLGEQILMVAPSNTETSFSYDALGQLLSSTDPDGFTTYYEYDMLGQMVRREHPDAGVDTYTYDPAGNMTSHTNGNGHNMLYDYYFNLPSSVTYPQYPANNVRYWYGEAGAQDNTVGRIALMADGSGWQTFKYGKLGEVTENIRTYSYELIKRLREFFSL